MTRNKIIAAVLLLLAVFLFALSYFYYQPLPDVPQEPAPIEEPTTPEQTEPEKEITTPVEPEVTTPVQPVEPPDLPKTGGVEIF